MAPGPLVVWLGAIGGNPRETSKGEHLADLSGKRIAFLATDMVEQIELTEPWKAVEQAGGIPELVSLEDGEIQGFNHYDKADKFTVDRTVDEVSADDYDGLVQPGADIKNAGGNWVDQEVVVDDGIITSRNPDDLPAFCSTLVEEFARAPVRA